MTPPVIAPATDPTAPPVQKRAGISPGKKDNIVILDKKRQKSPKRLTQEELEALYRAEARERIDRMNKAIAEGSLTEEDRIGARERLRLAGLVNENNELVEQLPNFYPTAWDEE